MTPWQLLFAGRARAALGYRVHHGPGVLMHHSIGLAAAQNSSTSFGLSRERVVMQHLNKRLAIFLQKVRCLEAANQKLELKIQEELAKKCPGELRELDKYLKKASLLQDQIGECHLAQAQLKLQLLSAELTSFDLKERCEKEREHRSRIETELNDLRMLGEELKDHKLPELQSLLDDHSKQLMELQMQHEQDLQVQESENVAVKIQTTGSSDLTRQLDDLRQTSMALMIKNQNESFDSTQVSMLSSPEMTFELEADQTELEDLRRTAASLEEDLKQLQALNVMLETSGLEQTESFVLQLEVLQQRADRLCNDLDSVLQVLAEQATDHQALLDIKTRLETEMNDYKRLLDGQSQHGFSSPVNDTLSFHATMGLHASKQNIAVERIGVEGGNLRIYQCQTVPRGRVHIVRKAPLVSPHPVTMTTGQIRTDISKHPKSQIVASVNRMNWAGSFQKSENRRVFGSQVSESFPEGAAVKTSTSEKLETSTSKQTTAEVSQLINHHTVISETTVCTVPLAIEESFTTHKTIFESSGQTATDAKEEKTNVITLQINDTEISNQADNQAQLQVLSSSWKTPEVDVRDTEGDDFRASDKEGLKTVSSEDSLVRASTESLQIIVKENEKSEETKEKEVLTIEGVLFPDGLDQKLVLSHVTTEEHKEIMEGADTLPCTVMLDPFCSQDGNGKAESTVSTASECHTVESSLIDSGIKGIDNKEVIDKKEEEVILTEEKSFILKAAQSSLCDTYSSSVKTENLDVGSDVVLHSLNTDVNFERKSDLVIIDQLSKAEEDPIEIENEMINLVNEEAPLRFTESASQSDSGVALSLSSTEEVLSSGEGHTLTEPVEYLRQEICLSPAEADVLMSMSDQVFCPLDRDVRSPDSLLNPELSDMFLNPNNDTCLSPVENKDCLSPNFGEEDEDMCLSPTEANMHVRPLEKYVLTTKEEEQSLSFSKDQALTKGDGNKNVTIRQRDSGSVHFGSFEDDKMNGVSLTGRKNSFKLTVSETGSHSELGGTGKHSVIADKEKQLGFGGLYRRNGDAPSLTDRIKSTKNDADINNANNKHSSPGGRPESGRFDRRGSGEWMVYSTLGQRGSFDDSTRKEEKEKSSSQETNFARSTPEPGRFGSKGSGEWKVYGGSTGRISSVPGMKSESAVLFATSPPETFGRTGNEEWLVNSGSLQNPRSQGGSDDLHKTERRESQPTTLNRATSPMEIRKYGSIGSGEWRVYGGSTGRISRWSASNSLPDADSKESPLVDRQYAMSPPTFSPPTLSPPTFSPPTLSPPTINPLAIPRTGRFASGGSGEWRVYGGSPGRLSSAGNADSANCGRIISPPSSRTSSVHRLGSSGSGGRLSSGSVVRRSSSAGSGGQLSGSSGSHRISSSGRYVSTGSGEWKPVYSSVSGRGSTAGSAGISGGVGNPSSQRAPSPGGRVSVSVGSSGWLSGGGSHMSGPGSGSKLSGGGSNERISSQHGARISSSSGSGRTSSSGGRVISSSSRSNRSTGSGTGSNKERISVCKMAALSISAAGRERQKDKKTQVQKSQSQQPGGKSPVVQRWLITGVGVTSADSEGLDDIMRL